MDKENNTKNKRYIWQQPWGLAEGIIIAAGLLLTGFMLQVILPNSTIVFEFPINAIVLAGLFILICCLSLLGKKNKALQWFGSINASLSAIAVFLLAGIILAVIPQNQFSESSIIQNLKLNRFIHSFPFALITLYFLLVLGFVSIKKMMYCKTSNIGFILNHLGLWITIAAGALGSADTSEVRIRVFENGDYVWSGNHSEKTINLPFAVRLFDFKMETFNPRLALIDKQTEKLHLEKNSKHLIENNSSHKILNYNIVVDTFYTHALAEKNYFLPKHEVGSCAAAHILVKQQNQVVAKGWISAGNYVMAMSAVNINDKYAAIMLSASAKKYESNLEIVTKTQQIDTVTIAVNKPHYTMGWHIYQYGYDARKGEWSDYSELLCTRDPWLPAVYAGLIMLTAGSILLFFNRKKLTYEL